MGVVGAAIKGFGKALKVGKRNKASKQVFDHVKGKPFPESTQRHMRLSDKRTAEMKKKGYKGPTYRSSGKKSKTGAHYLDEVWTYNPYKTPKKSKLTKIAKKTAPIAGAAAAGVAYGERKGKK